MVSHRSVRSGQRWRCSGVTLANPCFNTVDFFGAEDVSAQIRDFKCACRWALS